MSRMNCDASPAVSVVLPVYNAVATLDAALESLLVQTHPSFEVIAVDDGSTDTSAAVLAEHANRDNRLKIVKVAHGGIVAALNTGLATARGHYIARMDADDIAHPERLQRQAAYLDRFPDIGLVGCIVVFGGDRSASGGYARYVDWTNALTAPEQIALEQFRESPFAHPSVMFRVALVTQYGGYRQGSFPEDYELWLRWLEHGVRMAKVAGGENHNRCCVSEPPLPYDPAPCESVLAAVRKMDEQHALLLWNDSPERLSRNDLRCSVDRFYAMKTAYLARWLARNNPAHPHISVIGAGKASRRRALLLRQHGVVIDAWIDVDPRKIGNVVEGVRVYGRDALPAPGAGFCLAYLAGHGAAEELEAYLASLQYSKGRDYLLAS